MTPSDALATREGAAKRSQGHVQAGLLSREIRGFGVPTPWELRKATSSVALMRAVGGPRAVTEPEHVQNLPAREPGDVRHERWRRCHVGDCPKAVLCERWRIVWPSSVGLRGRALNHPVLRWLKTLVVSDREKVQHDRIKWGPGRRARSAPLGLGGPAGCRR